MEVCVLLGENAIAGGIPLTIDDEVRDEQAADAVSPVLRDFASFYASELRQVVGLAYVISGSRSGAEDLAQDAFLAAYKRWEQVGRYPNPGAWVRRVVSNRAVSVFRRRTAEARALLRFRGSESVVPELITRYHGDVDCGPQVAEAAGPGHCAALLRRKLHCRDRFHSRVFTEHGEDPFATSQTRTQHAT